MPGSSPGSGPGSGPGRCGQTPGQTPGQRCRSRGCHWATPRTCGTIEPAEPLNLRNHSALHWANNSTSSHPSAPATTPQMVMVMMSSRLCRRPCGLLGSAKLLKCSTKLVPAPLLIITTPHNLNLSLASSLDSISTLNLECVCPAYRISGGPISVVSTQRPCCCCSSEAVISSGLAAGLVCSFTDWSLTVHGRVDSRSIAWIAVVSRQVV